MLCVRMLETLISYHLSFKLLVVKVISLKNQMAYERNQMVFKFQSLLRLDFAESQSGSLFKRSRGIRTKIRN